MLKFFKYLSCLLVFIGALNWGLVGLFGFDLVAALFGEMSLLSRIIYITIGVSAIIFAISAYMCHKKHNEDMSY